MQHSMRRRRDGFILSQTLAAYLIALWLVPVTMMCIAALGGSDETDVILQDETAAVQLRRIFLFAYDVQVCDDCVFFNAQNREMTLSKVNDHVIIQPGTQIVFASVDSASFIRRENVLQIIYERNGKTYRKNITVLP